MSYATNTAVAQVLSRIGEVDDSPIAALPDGDGSAASPIVTTAAQIIIFLSEAGRELVKIGLLELYGSATYTSVPTGTRKALYSSFTMSVSGQVMWKPLSASWNSAAVPVCDRRWYEVHNPTIAGDVSSTPERVYPDADGVLLAPRPALSTKTLVLYGMVLPRDQAAGENIYDVPDHLVPAMIVYAALRTLGKVGGKSADSRAIYDDLVAQWAALVGPSAPVPGG